MEPEIQWIKIASAEFELTFNSEGLAEAEVRGKPICVVRSAGVWRACASKCPHAGGHLADGYVDAGGNIVCPVHRYKFSLTSGRNTTGEGYFLPVYPVEVRPDGIYVGLEKKRWFHWG